MEYEFFWYNDEAGILEELPLTDEIIGSLYAFPIDPATPFTFIVVNPPSI